jgi:hypothetical protein
MSRLNFIGRPGVAFDATNRQHRQWYYEFVKHQTWGRCPVRFIVADDHGDLLTMIQQRLNQYYTEREFGVKLAR